MDQSTDQEPDQSTDLIQIIGPDPGNRTRHRTSQRTYIYRKSKNKSI